MTEFVGIINITPDSFSEDGIFKNEKETIKKISSLIEEGASIIDIGAESTRPGATPVSHDDEWKRLSPILNKLKEIDAKISIDTRNSETAKKAISLGVDWINDVSGLNDKVMVEHIAKNNVSAILMHNLGVPANPKITLPENKNAVEEVLEWAKGKLVALEKKGIKRDKIIFDPGIGFGKTAEQSLDIIRNISEFKTLGVKILVGHSRKSFLKIFTDKPAKERDLETSIMSNYLAKCEVDYLRAHNIKLNKITVDYELLEW